MARETQILIAFERPRGVSDKELRDFIIDALESAGGCRSDDDHLFNSLGNVRVSKPIIPWREPTKLKPKLVNVVPWNKAKT